MQTPEIKPIPWDGSTHTRPDEIPPGLYLDTEDVFQRCPGISYSKIKKMLPPFTPRHLYDELVHPERYPRDSDAALYGRMLHCLVFEPEKFKEQFFETPPNFARRSNKQKEQWQEWVEQYGIDHIIHTPKQRALVRQIKEIVADLLSREYTRQALTEGTPEVCVFWRDAETNAKCKGRLDYIKFLTRQGLVMISDLKSVGRNHDPDEVRHNIGQNKYDIQAAYYMDGVQAATGWDPRYMLIYQRSKAPWFPQEYEIGPGIVGEARETYRIALRQLLKCYETNEWPSYSDRPILIDQLNPRERRMREGMKQ